MQTDPEHSRGTQQETWRKRLAQAESVYQEASEHLRLALARSHDVERPDSAEVLSARARKAAARIEYLRVLRIFTDLVLRGKSADADS